LQEEFQEESNPRRSSPIPWWRATLHAGARRFSRQSFVDAARTLDLWSSEERSGVGHLAGYWSLK
jgi:hypothetical protein